MTSLIIPLPKSVFPITFRCSSRLAPEDNHHNFRTVMVSSKYIPTTKLETKEELSQKIDATQISRHNTPSTIKFNRLQEQTQVDTGVSRFEFGHFVARQAQLNEEYWTAAWLRAETHWEDRPNDRYADSYKRKFAEQVVETALSEYNSLKKRCNAQLENCTCIVTVKKEDNRIKRTVLKSVVGTLDLSIRHLSHGQTFPGEQVKGSFFCLINRNPSTRYGYIANLCVAKSARRQGIARNMLQFAINSAKEQGAEKVYVHVHRHNKLAQDLYWKLGFEIVDAASSQLSPEQTYLLCFDP